MEAHNYSSEESPLLTKNSYPYQEYSQRTVATLSTSGSSEQFYQAEAVIDAIDASHIGSVVVIERPSEQAEDTKKPSPIQDVERPRHDQAPSDGQGVSGMVGRVQDFTETVLEELHEAHDGEKIHYLEMGLTRNLSILPEDVVDAAIGGEPPRAPLPSHDADLEWNADIAKPTDESQKPIPTSAYFLLLTAIISLSSIGPLLQLQKDASSSLKIVWRMLGTSIVLFPFAVSDIFKYGWPKMNSSQWTTFLLGTVCYDVLTLAFVLSLQYTAVGNAVILSNSLSLILLMGKLLVGDPISSLEGYGALVAFGGAVLCSKDSAESNGGSNGLFGDALAVLSAIGGVGYLVFAKNSRQHMSMYLFMFLTMFVGGLLVLCFQVTVLGEHVTLDMDVNHGVWGFLLPEPDRLPLEACMVAVCNFFGTMGYVRAMQYFDNLVISSAALLEPVVAEFMACFLGVGHLPGVHGWLGNLLVGLGTFAVIYEDGQRKKGKSCENEIH